MKRVSFLLLVCLSFALVQCGPATIPAQPTQPSAPTVPPPAPTATPAPRVLRVAATANVTTWDPSASFSTEVLYMVNLYEPLLYVNPPGSAERFRPALAESWEVSPDGLQWTFHLRKGVKFHDGENLTAQAVKQSIERTIQLGLGAAFIWAPVDKIEALDDYTVRFQLKYAAALDLIAASSNGAWIMSPKAIAAATADPNYFEQGISAGTGPYYLESYTPDKEVVLAAFPDYWGGWTDVPHFDKIVVSIVPEAVTQQQMLDGGEVDLALSLPLENIHLYQNNPNFEFRVEPSMYNYAAYLNTRKPPFDNKLVRQAVSYAIPYEDIIAVGAQGFGKQSRGPVPEGVWPYSPNVKQYPYDPQKAKELMKQAGFEGGGLHVVLTYAAENQSEERFAPIIKDALAEIGIDVEIRPMLWKQQWELAKGDPTKAQDIFLLLYWPTYADAGTDNMYSLFHSEEKPFFNLSYYSNPEYDQLIDEAATLVATDPTRSAQLYEQALNLLVDDAPAVFLYDVQTPLVVPKWLKGFTYNMNYPFTLFFYPLYAE